MEANTFIPIVKEAEDSQVYIGRYKTAELK